MERPPTSAVAGLLLLTLVGPVSAQNSPTLTNNRSIQIVWASDAFASNLMADGTTTFGGSAINIQFELGTFTAGFNPAATPPSDWAAHWVSLQTASYDTGEDQVIQTATLATNSSPFTENTQAYIWGYTTKDVAGGVAQWILLAADEWKWPSVDAMQPSVFSVSEAAKSSEVIFGSVNGSINGVDYHMQLAAVPVPEPAAITLSGLALAGLVLRRKR